MKIGSITVMIAAKMLVMLALLSYIEIMIEFILVRSEIANIKILKVKKIHFHYPKINPYLEALLPYLKEMKTCLMNY